MTLKGILKFTNRNNYENMFFGVVKTHIYELFFISHKLFGINIYADSMYLITFYVLCNSSLDFKFKIEVTLQKVIHFYWNR